MQQRIDHDVRNAGAAVIAMTKKGTQAPATISTRGGETNWTFNEGPVHPISGFGDTEPATFYREDSRTTHA